MLGASEMNDLDEEEWKSKGGFSSCLFFLSFFIFIFYFCALIITLL